MRKIVLFSIFCLAIAFAYAQPRQKLDGTINNKLPIYMEVIMMPYKDGLMHVGGVYWYTNNPNGGTLNVMGTYNSDTGEVNLTEKNSKEVITGYFIGKYDDTGTIIKGKWLSANKQKSFDFILKHQL
ncbi:MAG: hypothetical protein MUE85_11835 [Microscillaceae bacterium]|jgi:hypothetical protein|nr:hypothetical protein [Microscillaceae bacterium]